jgi:glycosyltransferase involved in cell wall biosynthesis
MSRISWTVVTGEFPPDPGGVSDYTGQVASALRRAGDAVRVWTPGTAREERERADGVGVVRSAGAFRAGALRRLEAIVLADPAPRRLLVQYVPHSFGWRAMNLPFARWVGSFRAAPVDVMFHEVATPWSPRPPRALRAAVTRLMARAAARRASRVFVSTESWVPLLRRLGVETTDVLAIPSNLPPLPVGASAWDAAAPVRVGHFGTFGAAIAPLLAPAISELLDRLPGARAVFVGRGSAEFAARLAAGRSDLATRLEASGEVPGAEAAALLGSCHLLVQPYPDGATTRRSSLAAGLALGRPVVTNRGSLTEPVWDRMGGVVLAPDAASVAEHAARLAADAERRQTLGAAARATHAATFSVEHTVRRLRQAADEGSGA